ncbi:TonB-dependent receptor [Ideonella sp. YS5]|uniref:TonB-dependent receptor n=1 Tax=Ideonella sp. YS5 TaxID=3453714 RepID=UPI003EED23D9
MWSGATLAQTAPPADDAKGKPTEKVETIVVTGQRAALQSAQKIKQESDEIVDSIVADDIGKLPDRSVTEVLQRMVGVTIDRTISKNDPEHFSIEGSGVQVRGLNFVRSELNGRDSFSANGGRALNFEDVPPELMAGVDVYKNPSAEQTEGAIGGLVNLRTFLPFDFPGTKVAITAKSTYSVLRGKSFPEFSLMASNRWDTDLGQFGAMVDLAHSESSQRSDTFQVEPYYRQTVDSDVWIPKGVQYRREDYDRARNGIYGALQWKLNDLSSSLTYFKSDYKMTWNEHALFAQSNPYNITVDDGATYGPNGNFLKGTLRDAADGGINFNDDTRFQKRHSSTEDFGWNTKWKASDRWSFSADLQYVRAKTESFDSTVATGVQMAKENVDLSGSRPRLVFDADDIAYLADPSHYYWGFTMEHMDKSYATEKAGRLDAKFKFDDPHLLDLRFGVRLTNRDASTVNSNPSYNWASISQPWQVGWALKGLAYLGDPRFSGNAHLRTFDNFFNSDANVPGLIFPDVSVAAGYPNSYATLHSYSLQLCEDLNGKGSPACQGGGVPWSPATFGTDPLGTNNQHEHTQAAYSQLRFAFDDWKWPVDGNVGLRLVRTSSTADGYTVFNNTAPSFPDNVVVDGVPIPKIASFAEAQNLKNSYTNALPSLNLRMKASDQLQFRAGYAAGISRPDFTDLQAYTTLSETADVTNHPDGSKTVNSVTLSGSASGNALLKPVRSQSLDLSAEWYFGKADSLTFVVFHKDLKDIIIKQTSIKQLADVDGGLHDFIVTSPINGAKGSLNGLELAFQQYFDRLPGWMAGFGVQANYTFVDSKQTLYTPVFAAYCGSDGGATNLNRNLNGCDTDGRTFGNLPIKDVSRNAFNLALLYDRGPVSARLAYSWRSKYLQNVNVNGTNGGDGLDSNPDSPTYGQHNVAWALPTWQDSFGQLDGSISYRFDDNLQIGLEGTNLTDSTNKQLMQQHIGMMGRAWHAVGPSYAVRLSYTF